MREVSCPRSKRLLKYAKMWTSSLYVGSRTSGSEYDDWCTAKHTQLPTAAGSAHVHRPPVPGTCMSGSNCPVTTRGTAYLMYLQSAQDRAFVPKAYNTRQRATPQLSLAPFEENGQQFERPVDPRSAIVGGLCTVLRQAFGRAVPNFLVGPHGMWSCYQMMERTIEPDIEVLSHSRMPWPAADAGEPDMALL